MPRDSLHPRGGGGGGGASPSPSATCIEKIAVNKTALVDLNDISPLVE